MNKIVLDKENIISLCVSNDSICNIGLDYNIKELNIKINDGVKFVINQYSENNSILNINIIQNNNSSFIYNHSFKNNKEYKLNIDVKLCGNNSKNYLNIHGVSDNSLVDVSINGSVLKNTSNNVLDEKIKLLNINNGKSKINPNMFIDTKNVYANHSASISTIDSNYLFYLNSKGLDNKESIDLIIDGFLNNIAR